MSDPAPSRRRAPPVLLLLLAQGARAVQLYYGLDELRDLEAVEIVDSRGVVQKHTLLSFSNHACRERGPFSKGFPWNFIHLNGEGFELGQVMVDEPANELMEFFDVRDCASYVFLPRGARLAEHKGGGKHKLAPANESELEEWFWGFLQVGDFRLRNDGDATVAVYWEAADGEFEKERPVMTLAPGAEKRFDTFQGHTLVWREATHGGMGRLLTRVVVTDAAAAAGRLVLSELLGAGRGDTEALQLTEAEARTWRGRARTNLARIRQNERQPPTVPGFSDVGFKHVKMPAELHARLLAFYREHEAERRDEGWQSDDLHVNFYQTMTTVVHASPVLKDAVIDYVRPILSEWIGHVDTLDHTSTYGIRRHYNGSRLRDHADIGSTHIVSAILNIGQDTDEVWWLHILDHEGRRHFIEMAAGDMVLYESAKNVHGRPTAMNGRSYDNIFTHFRPTSWANGGRPAFTTKTQFHDEEEFSDFSDEEWFSDEEEDEGLWSVQEKMAGEGQEDGWGLLEEM